MIVLGMDTTTDAASAAVMEDGILRARLSWQVPGKKHAQTALPGMDQLLTFSGWRLQQMDALAVAVGPGSFTGVRIGAAHMSGLGNVLGIPVYSVSTFDALRALAPSQMAVLAMLDARRDQVYVQCTDADGTELIAPAARPLEGVLHQLADVRSLYITGDALVRHEDCIREALPHAHLAPAAGRCPDAAGVCTCVFRGWAKKETFDTIKPVYLRRPQAERERLERAQREQ